MNAKPKTENAQMKPLSQMTHEEKEGLFNALLPIAERAARHYSKRYQRPIYETRDHAQFALCLLIYDTHCNFNPEKQTMEVWIAVKLHWHLREVYQRGLHPWCGDLREPRSFKEIPCSDLMEQWEAGVCAEPPQALSQEPPVNWLNAFIEPLSEEGRALVDLLMSAPADLWNDIKPVGGRSKQCRQRRLFEYLVDVLDWNIPTAEKAFTEIQKQMAVS